jgi:hypothetical protein
MREEVSGPHFRFEAKIARQEMQTNAEEVVKAIMKLVRRSVKDEDDDDRFIVKLFAQQLMDFGALKYA